MKIHDISVTLTPELAVWPGDRAVYLQRERKIEEGSNSNVSRLDISVHTGTHVDAPVHFLPGGGTIENLALELLVGEAQVVHIAEDVELITAKEICAAKIREGMKRVLFKTRNSRFFPAQSSVFHTDFVGINEEGAQLLVKMGLRLVGIDYLSVAPFKKTRPTHEVLLKAGIVLLEGVDLSQVEAGEYLLCCLPLKLGGSDGAPARVVLIEQQPEGGH